MVQFGGGPALLISGCLLVVVQFGGGPADAGNCVASAIDIYSISAKKGKGLSMKSTVSVLHSLRQ